MIEYYLSNNNETCYSNFSPYFSQTKRGLAFVSLESKVVRVITLAAMAWRKPPCSSVLGSIYLRRQGRSYSLQAPCAFSFFWGMPRNAAGDMCRSLSVRAGRQGMLAQARARMQQLFHALVKT